MIWEILTNIASLNVEGLLGLVMGNLHWVFSILAVSYFFFNARKPIRAFVHVSFAILFMAELVVFVGWHDFSGQFLLLYFLLELGVLIVAQNIPFLSKRLVWVEEANFFGSIILFNLFLAG